MKGQGKIMYIYDLDVSMSDKELIFDKKLMEAIKQAINIANSSFSAIRYNRKIELVETINNTNIHLRMTSRNPINATRSLSSLSRALVRNEKEKNSGLLEGHIINGCVFNTKLLNQTTSFISNLNPTEIVQEVVAIVLGQKFLNDKERILAKEASDKIRDVVIEYVNKKNEV